MSGMKEGQEAYVARFSQFIKETSGEPSWLRTLRQSAMDRFAVLGFPTGSNEDWKYTNVEPIAEGAFQSAEKTGRSLTRERLASEPLTTLQCSTRLVFVNGIFSEQLSSLGKLPEGVKAASLARLLKTDGESIEKDLARQARFAEEPFVALNTAFIEDGALVEIPRGCALEEPILVVFVSMPGGRPLVSHPRNLYLFGAESRGSIIESYLSIGAGAHFTNAVSELVAAEGAAVEHYKLQMESEEAFHVATVQMIQERDSRVFSHNVSFGGALTRNDLNVVFNAEGAECNLGGLFMALDQQHVDNHTTLDHAKPHCVSREVYKGILGGRGVGVFNGKVFVRKDAQKTDSLQSNKNLLLSEGAVINTKPQLEIDADDVRCKHGATVGQINQEAIFYMRSRGIPKEAAGDLLTYAFAGEVLDSMSWVTVRSRLEQILYRKLSKDRQGR